MRSGIRRHADTGAERRSRYAQCADVAAYDRVAHRRGVISVIKKVFP